MKHRLLTWSLLLLTLPLSVWSAEPTRIVGPNKIDVYKLVTLAPDGDQANAAYVWDIDREDIADMIEVGNKLIFTGPPGTYKIKLMVFQFKDNRPSVNVFRHTVIIGQPGPTPPNPPDPPVPPPDPPSPAPIPLEGFRVLMVFERKDKPTYSPGILNVLEGKTVRDYLDSKCVKGPTGEPERRIWDADTDGYSDAKHWGDAMKRKRDKLPWIIISNGKTGYEGPLPNNPAEALELLKKYGG